MNAPPRYLAPAVLVLSAAGIAYQIALMRVLSIAQWHHFAYMIISIAMLGFGASGAVLALARHRLAGWEEAALRTCALLSAAAMAGCYVASQRVPFETFQLATQPGHWHYLLALYLLLAVPFLLVAACVALAFMLVPARVGRLYAFDLGGSGLGAFAAVALLYAVAPNRLPYLLAAAVLGAFGLLCARRPAQAWAAVGAAAAVGLGLATPWATPWIEPIRLSEYKGLAYARHYPDAEEGEPYYSPLSVLTPLESSVIRETPGQLGGYPMSELGELPRQTGLFFDGGAVSPVNDFSGFPETFAWTDYVTAAAAYRLVDRPRVAIAGAGGGTEVAAALWHGAAHVDAIEVEGNVFAYCADNAPALYNRPDVTPVVAEARGYLRASDGGYGLIHLPLMGSFSASSAGVFALNETYLYTVEAFTLYLDRLAPDGVLSVNCWLKTPPRDALKLFATLVEAGEALGMADPGRHLILLRSWNNATLLMTRAPLDAAQIAAVRDFATARGFDLGYYPGIQPGESNRYTVLEHDHYFEGARRILSGDRAAYYRDYLFYIRPATDDRPYFFRSFKWRSLPRLYQGMGTEWVPFVELGYTALIVTLLQALLVAVVLIVAPLLVLGRTRVPTARRRWVVAYFAALGAGYMVLEIAFIQLFMRFLAYPVYAVAVVLTAFLLASGAGSAMAHRYRAHPARLVAGAVRGIAVLALGYLAVLPAVFAAGGAWPDALKIGVSLVLLAPLAFCMGMPFPVGLRRAVDCGEGLLPWAWGINGCASVIGATLATVLAVHLGFRGVVAVSVALYGLAWFGFGRMARARSN